MAISAIRTNAGRLVRTRLAGWISPTAANRVVTPAGSMVTLPGQGGVVLGIGLGDRASGWAGDHVEPGISIIHTEAAANQALRLLSCAGNPVTVLDGGAAGARGFVSGKHGAVLAMLGPAGLDLVAPGDRIAIEACGVGLAVEDEPDLVCHSCSPGLFERWIDRRSPDGRLAVPVAAVLPALAGAAGIGMPAAMFNMDLNTDRPPIAELARDLRFGDIVAVLDHDHRVGRRLAAGWTAVGVISHGQTAGGGHGLGLMTLLTAPSERLDLIISSRANLTDVIVPPWL